MAKKKAAPPQSSTLLNWFSHDTSTAGKGKGTPKKPPPTQTKRKKSNNNNNTIPPDPSDIIVIPSDSEDEGETAVVKKRRKSSELKMKSKCGSQSIREVVEAKTAEVIDDQEMLAVSSITTTIESSSFGLPDESLLPTIQYPTSHALDYRAASPQGFEGSLFGAPSALLLGPSVSKSSGTNAEAGPSTLVRECSNLEMGKCTDNSQFEDDWIMEDDEGVKDEADDEIEFVDTEPLPKSITPPSEPSNSKQSRPISHAPASCSGENAYSVLMASNKDNQAWKEADSVEDSSFRPTKANGSRRKAPFYKVLQGMPIAVDAFKYGAIPGINAYFLTHAHSDHYTNLSSSWKNGPIYCSEGTANLVKHMLKVDPQWVHPLPMDIPTVIPNTGGVQVTLIEANHCPGSCLFFYEGQQTVNAGDSNFKSPSVGSNRTFRYLHCGDFRASPRHVFHPAVRGKRIDHVYLDTTYLDPRYTFPPQPLVISACAELATRIVENRTLGDQKSTLAMTSWLSTGPSKEKQKEMKENILMVVGTYSIGKERIVKAIAKALNSKVYCDSRKAAILRCQADPELDALLTSNPLAANVHVVPLGFITSDKLEPYVNKYKGHFTKAVGFRPTGWTYTPPAGEQAPTIASVLARCQKNTYTYADLQPSRNSTSKLQLYPVPYSEHSSFSELTCFALSFEWTKMIATVNVGSEASRGKMGKWMQKWEAERKKKGKGYTVPNRHGDYW
ncbi:DNA cross-link repair protein PSO2/SNM1 [Marasmius crinis-equi]|uniref:DNA cross-link repair protein PSO2/SNM1 n=1 Tax=Marasmius crinis-equi TaxID=585013 RepID=A0ABR3F5Q5_9AGAR